MAGPRKSSRPHHTGEPGVAAEPAFLVRQIKRKTRFLTVATLVGAGATALMAGEVAALDLDGTDGLITETVADRERLKDYDNIKMYGAERVREDRDRAYVNPEGFRTGNYLIFPSVDADIIFDDNIFGRDAEKISDTRFELTPEVKFTSQLPRHVLNFSMGGKLVSYAENTEQNYENLRATADGALHFDHAHTLAAHILTELTHEERGSITAPSTAIGPVPVFHNRFTAGITRDVGRLYGTLSATAESFDFQDVRAVDGATLDQDCRDTESFSGPLRAGDGCAPGYECVS